MTNKIHVQLDKYLFGYSNRTLINIGISFIVDELIFVKLNSVFKLAKIIETYPNKNTGKEVAVILVVNYDPTTYAQYSLSKYAIDEDYEFFLVDKVLIDGKVINLFNHYYLEDIKIKYDNTKVTEETN